MKKFSFQVNAIFADDKSIQLELTPELIALLRLNGCLEEGRTKGSWGIMPDAKTLEIRRYAAAAPERKIVKDEEKIGDHTLLQRLKKKFRVTTGLPTDLPPDVAKQLYEHDAALVAQAIEQGLFKPNSTHLTQLTTNLNNTNITHAA